MRRHRPRSPGDLDSVDVVLVEDEDGPGDVVDDRMRTVLHELALEAMAWRATWPGESRPLVEPEVAEVPRPSWPRRLAHRYRRRAATCAVLAVAVATTAAVVDARQTAARAAALAAMPAVLADASSAPTELWRVPGRVVGDGDDRLLVADGARLHAVDPATGDLLWTASAAAGRAASAGDCFPVDEALRPDRAPTEDAVGPRGLVACVADGRGGTAQDGDAAAVVVVDSATGRTRHSVAVQGALLLAEPVGRDLLVVDALGDGTTRITRWDLATGTPRWDRVGPGPGTDAGDGGARVADRRPGSVTVGAFAVDLATGEVLDAEGEEREPHPYVEHVLPGGARATWGWLEDGTSGRGRVSGGTRGPSFFLAGPPLRPSVTDGSDARVLVVHTARRDWLRGVDLRTGRTRWTRPSPSPTLRATALVEGVMVLDGGSTVTALDVRTGTDLWRTAVDLPLGARALTDGHVVLLGAPADDDALHLVARRIADGAVVWRAAAPPGTVSMTVVDHRLVASTDDHVVGLG